ncbi:hypothetical protein AAHH67_15875 [Niallia circulans]
MTVSLPMQKQTIKGKEYLLFKSEVFYALFQHVVSNSNVDEKIVKYLNAQYRKAMRIKKRRIKLKKKNKYYY